MIDARGGRRDVGGDGGIVARVRDMDGEEFEVPPPQVFQRGLVEYRTGGEEHGPLRAADLAGDNHARRELAGGR